MEGLEALLDRVLVGQSQADSAITRSSWLELAAAWQHTLQLATNTMAPREVRALISRLSPQLSMSACMVAGLDLSQASSCVCTWHVPEWTMCAEAEDLC